MLLLYLDYVNCDLSYSLPFSDAVWEKDGYYDDLYVEHWRCDVPICLHPEGRKGDSRNKYSI